MEIIQTEVWFPVTQVSDLYICITSGMPHKKKKTTIYLNIFIIVTQTYTTKKKIHTFKYMHMYVCTYMCIFKYVNICGSIKHKLFIQKV